MAIQPGALIGAGAGLLGSIFGIGQSIRARAIEKSNIRPFATVNANIAQNAAIANNMAQVGLPNQQYNQALQQQNQNLSSVLGTIGRNGRSANIAGILRQANLATQNLNVQDAVTRRQNQQIAMAQNQDLAQEQQRVWNWNFANPYLQRLQQVNQLRNAGTQNIFGGLGTIASIGIQGGFGDNK